MATILADCFITFPHPPHYLHPLGAWYYIMDIVSKLSVVTNAWLIAVTANYIPFLVYRGLGYDAVQKMNYPNTTLGFVHWSQSSFSLSVLLNDSAGSSSSAFPLPTSLKLKLYDESGEVVTSDASPNDKIIYLPFVNYNCMKAYGCYNATNNDTDGFTIDQWKSLYIGEMVTNNSSRKCRDLLYELSNPNDTLGITPIKRFNPPSRGGCFNSDVTCRLVNMCS